MDKPHSKYLHVYAIVRFDLPVSQSNPENSAIVVKVLSSRVLAEQEASRLREVNKEKRCVYNVQITRFVETRWLWRHPGGIRGNIEPCLVEHLSKRARIPRRAFTF